MDGEYHVTCLVREDSFFLGSDVVKELVDLAHSVLCRGRLLRRDGTEGHQHGAVDCTCVIKESTKDLLYVLFKGGIKERLGVFGFRELLLCSIVGGSVGVRLVLSMFRAFTIEAFEGIGDVIRHGEMDLSLGVIPVKSKSEVAFAFPVFSDVVMLFDGVDEVGGVFFAYVFHSEIVDNEEERDGSPIVRPQTRCVLALVVSLTVEALFEELLGEDARLGQAIHSPFYGDVHKSIGCYLIFELVVVNDIRGKVGHAHTDIFLALERGHQIEICNVKDHELGSIRGYDAVQ